MLTTIPGIYRNGQIELAEQPGNLPGETQVLVTFLTGGTIDLASRGIDASAAAELRSQLASFTEEWSSPEMAVYDDYDAHRQP